MRRLGIGVVAARAGVKVDTVRYYERRGVLPPAERRSSGYRSFEPQAIDRIRFVKQMQSLGFSLDDLVEMLRNLDAGDASCETARPHVRATIERLEQQIAALTAIRDRLDALRGECQAGVCALTEAAPLVRISKRGPA